VNVFKMLPTLRNTLKKIKLPQDIFDSRFSDFSEYACLHL